MMLSSSLSSPFTTLNVAKMFLKSQRPATPKNYIDVHSSLPPVSLTFKPNVSQMEPRRSANYHPTIWDSNVIESFTTPYSYDEHATRLEKLTHEAKRLLKASTKEPCVVLNLIDSMQRLGVAYHFQDEITEILNLVELDSNSDLYSTALHFRLLRQHGFNISSDVLDKFRNENGKFNDNLREDMKGLLSLYDASYLGMNGEDSLEEAKRFSTEHLKCLLEEPSPNHMLRSQVEQALDVPLHLRMPRIEARNYINIYQKDDTCNLALLELAKLDYNLLQSTYQKELKELSRWWKNLGLTRKLHFSRDRLMENYFWSLGMIFEPQFSKCRIVLTKFVCILSTVDDMYDIYGSLEELEIFTRAIQRWDVTALAELPEYMQICYLAILNFANELAYEVLNEKGLNILPYIKEEWIKLCESYMVEARWFSSGYTPTFKEYQGNAWISVGGHESIVHSFAFLGHPLTEDSLKCLKHGFQLIYWSSLIARLNDDLGTFEAEVKRGDVAKSIQCYMIDKGVSEEEAKDYISGLIIHAWKKLNEETVNPSYPRSLVNICLNMAKASQCIFQHGDGIGTSIGLTKNHLRSLVVEPIP